MFDIFRRYTVGDVIIKRDDPERYTLNNLLTKTSKSIRRFNEIAGRPFKALLANHQEHKLYHIDINGIWTEETYKAIGSGEKTANIFFRRPTAHLSTKEGARYVFLAIMYTNWYCPGIGGDVEPYGAPDVIYLSYNEEWDRTPAPEDILEFKECSNEKLERIRVLIKLSRNRL